MRRVKLLGALSSCLGLTSSLCVSRPQLRPTDRQSRHGGRPRNWSGYGHGFPAAGGDGLLEKLGRKLGTYTFKTACTAAQGLWGFEVAHVGQFIEMKMTESPISVEHA